jgi:DNA-directed RNA polymerase specialized sigma subunit
MNALDKIAKLAADATPSRSEQDLALWKAWKKSPTDANLSAVLKQLEPLVQREASKWAGTLARPLLETDGRRLAVEALHDYDPSRGAAVGTHVATRLQKMSRLSYANQNVARLPENKMLMFHTYTVGHAQLTDSLGRTPTTDELADHLSWSIPHLTKFRREISHHEMLESGGAAETGSAGLFEADEQDSSVDFLHHDLPPQQKLIFEYLTGYGGAPILSNTEIQKKLGLTQGVYSYQKAKIVEKAAALGGKRG